MHRGEAWRSEIQRIAAWRDVRENKDALRIGVCIASVALPLIRGGDVHL